MINSNELLKFSNSKPVAIAENSIPDLPGIYSIFISDRHQIPEPFSTRLKNQKTNLIYIGKSDRSLYERLFREDLKHKSASTFFRSIGAVLGFVPSPGSLIGKSNQENYKFTKQDTDSIIKWINENLRVNWVVNNGDDLETIKKNLIGKKEPVINIKYNNNYEQRLYDLREKCIEIATSAK